MRTFIIQFKLCAATEFLIKNNLTMVLRVGNDLFSVEARGMYCDDYFSLVESYTDFIELWGIFMVPNEMLKRFYCGETIPAYKSTLRIVVEIDFKKSINGPLNFASRLEYVNRIVVGFYDSYKIKKKEE